MLPAAMKKALIAFTETTEKQPNQYVIEGFLVGLAATQNVLRADYLLQTLFGNYQSIHKIQLETLLFMCEEAYTLVTEEEYQLPKACVLPKKEIEPVLAKEQPLPSFCQGVVAAFDIADTTDLPTLTRHNVNNVRDLFHSFTSLAAARESYQGMEPVYSFEQHMQQLKRSLKVELFALKDALSWGEEDDEALLDAELLANDYVDGLSEFEQAQREELVDELLMLEGVASIPRLDAFIAEEEQNIVTPAFKRENEGVFWLMHETRPYMLVRHHKAMIYFNADKIEMASKELEELLRLNPSDNQGCRYMYANCLVILQQWQKLEALLEEFDEPSLSMLGAKALMFYAQQRSSEELKALKSELKQSNKHFIRILTGQEKYKEGPVYMYSRGSKEEVIMYITNGGKKAWLSVEGSLFWLRKKE
ncbi:hypothetical protein [Pseudoalteromonas sp. UG3-2]|uniref:hypothetical protein n=2 Tax=unclassified Pseudoalteromonas TaxID=194690 RepID=UPI0030155AC2